MKKYLLATAIVVMTGLVGTAQAAPITYNFIGPTAGTNTDLGQTHVYSAAGGPNLTAMAGVYGGTEPAGNGDSFTASSGVHLVGNNRGAGEQGLGICGSTSGNCNGSHLTGEDGEIDYAGQEVVRLDISGLYALFTNFKINADSATEGEKLAIYQGNSASNIGVFLMQIDDASGDVGIAPTGQYLYFLSNSGAGGANVLLHSLTITPDVDINPVIVDTPEPVSMALLGSGLVGLAVARRRRRA